MVWMVFQLNIKILFLFGFFQTFYNVLYSVLVNTA